MAEAVLTTYEANTELEPAAGSGNIFSKILIPLFDPVHARPYSNFASVLLSPRGKLLGLKVLDILGGESLSAGAERAPLYRATMEELNSQLEESGVELKTQVCVVR